MQLESAVINGEWPVLLQLLEKNSFKDSNKVFEAVYAHMIMELVLMDEKHLARQILDEQKALLVPNWYQDLWSILYEGRQPFTMEKEKNGKEITLTDPIVVKSR